MISPPSEAQQRTWVAQWRSAAIALARVRLAELARVDLARVAADLEDASLAAAPARAASRTSGLVVQQQIFLRHRGRA
ncbi:MAG: hypothetical protein ACREL5_07550 [Gemmatimonadales bacterium]